MRCVAVAVVIAAMVFGSAAMAQTSRLPPGMASVAGKLIKIDGKALTIAATVNGETKDTVVTCDNSTRFGIATSVRSGEGRVEGKETPGAGRPAAAKFGDLKVGQQVTVVYNIESKIAGRVRITAEPPEASSPASTSTKEK